MADVVIQRAITVSGGACKRSPWRVEATETIDNKTFVVLCKNDQGFNRFVTGSPKGLKEAAWLDHLRSLRSAAMRAEEEEAAKTGLFDDPSTPTPKKKRRRSRMPTAPLTVDIKLPAVEHDGVEVDELVMKVKAESDSRLNISLELTAENLKYVRVAMLQHDSKGVSYSRSKPEYEGEPKQLRWLARRKAWLAISPCKQKTFRVRKGAASQGPFELEVVETRDRARAWAASGIDGAVADDSPEGDECAESVGSGEAIAGLEAERGDGTHDVAVEVDVEVGVGSGAIAEEGGCEESYEDAN